MKFDSLQRVVEPGAEPIHLDEAKRHVKQDDSEDDPQFPLYVAGVREHFEETARLAIVTQTLEVGLADWPDCDEIQLPRPPLVAVESVQYTLDDDTVQNLDSSSYVVDTRSEPGRIILKADQSWPSDALQVGLPIVIRYQAGTLTPVEVDAAAGTLTALGRTFAAGTAVQVANSGGALPGGLRERVTYYVRDVSGSTFKLAASSGGSAIALGEPGTGTHFVFTGPYPWSILQALRLLLGHWYEHREAVIDTGRRTLLPVPLAFESLLWQTRRF